MNISSLLDRKAVLPRAGVASKRHALGVLAEAAARAYGLDHDAAAAALTEREAKASTGMGFGVALPHARIEGLERTVGVFARLETPVEFEALDGQPVDLIFALFTPAETDRDHLRALAKVSRVFRRADLREQLRQARTTDAVFALLSQEELQGAAA
jgi:nitrogen PTS system EIIA component